MFNLPYRKIIIAKFTINLTRKFAADLFLGPGLRTLPFPMRDSCFRPEKPRISSTETNGQVGSRAQSSTNVNLFKRIQQHLPFRWSTFTLFRGSRRGRSSKIIRIDTSSISAALVHLQYWAIQLQLFRFSLQKGQWRSELFMDRFE